MKKIIHHIYFEVSKNKKVLFKTQPFEFGTPEEKQGAGNVLNELKKTYSDNIYTINKFIIDIEIREYSVNK